MAWFLARKRRLAAVFPILLYLSALSAVPAADPAAASLSRSRTAALLTALFHHDVPAEAEEFRRNAPGGASLGSLSPRRVEMLPERAKILDFAHSLVYEGGYFPGEIYQMLGYSGAVAARIARLTRQLDRAAGSGAPPSPWEAAGRVGRSGLGGASDHWAMAPGEDGEPGVLSPGTLAYLPALAVTYAEYPADGREAAAQLAVLKDDDLRAGPAARAAFSLLHNILTADRHDKDAWLVAASADGGDADTEQDVRAVRIKDWRYLRGEECAMGRLERAIHIWYKSAGYEESLAAGRERLRSSESLAYLASLAAATYGMESLPRRVIVAGSEDRQLLDLINDLYDLATSEAVLRVASETP
jgi:hypothetical protein